MRGANCEFTTSSELGEFDELAEEDSEQIDLYGDLVGRFVDADRCSQEYVGNVITGGVGKAEFPRNN